ncbi:hypothetical protein [Burkholderia ambifaria]|uniref:hypothetical protein n=1 Tax=Burkholderia ambifaria TaxID=152480 RepID=UPI001ABB62A8|nr:hypothetical protein [Burkholderia ambifaria]
MNRIVAGAACASGSAAVSGHWRSRAFHPMNRLVSAAPQPDTFASFASVTRSAPTPIIRVPFIDA